MAIGPQDYIDDLLVKKYQDKQVNNIADDMAKLTMSSDRYWDIMRDYAQAQRMMFAVKNALTRPKAAKPVPKQAPA